MHAEFYTSDLYFISVFVPGICGIFLLACNVLDIFVHIV